MAITDYSPIVGKAQLESLIIRLYSDPRTIFREYVQNACDSIYDAVKYGVLSSVEEGHVVIDINSTKKCIQVLDNGMGIPKESALSTLMDIFHSGKDGIEYAGQYGIGRLAGGGYCKELIFRTTALGEDVETVLKMDIQLLKKILDDPLDDRSAEQVMQHICTVAYSSANVDEHYMIVCLKDVTNSTEILLDEEGISEYLRDIAPIDYQVPFKQLINKNLPKEYQERFNAIRHIHVSVNNNNDLKKRYGLKIVGNGDEIKKLRFFSIVNAQYGSLAWGWYAVTPFTVQIPSSDKNVGIRLRKLNISLDINILNEYFKEERGNSYFYGEVFIDNDNVKPNSGRQGLSSGDETEGFIKELKEYFKNLTKVYTMANKMKNSLKIVRERYKVYLEKKNSIGQHESTVLLNFLSDDVKKFKKIVEDTRYSDEVKDVSEIYLAKYNDELKNEIQSLYAPKSAPNPDPQIPTPIITNVPPRNPVAPTPPIIDAPKNPVIPVIAPPKPPKSPQPPISVPNQPKGGGGINDSLQRLIDAGFSQNDVNLTRRIFGYMNILCPPANKALLKQLKEKTIDLLIDNQI